MLAVSHNIYKYVPSLLGLALLASGTSLNHAIPVTWSDSPNGNFHSWKCLFTVFFCKFDNEDRASLMSVISAVWNGEKLKAGTQLFK